MTGVAMFLLCGVLGSVSGQFFHESSGVTLKPSGGLASLTNSSFGFSIAHQKHNGSLGRLLIGAPRQDYVGKVYSCPLSDLSSINCSIDVTSLQIENKLSASRKSKYPDEHYFLGSSIVATTDYFFTCAPLLIKSVELCKVKYIDKQWYCKYIKNTETFGGCYVNNYTSAAEWIDNIARLEDKHRSIKIKKRAKYSGKKISFGTTDLIGGGGLGWNTLADDSFLIAAKSGYETDILYSNVNEPSKLPSKSLLDYENAARRADRFTDFFNMGYGLTVGNFFSKSEKLYAVSVRTDLEEKIFFLQKKYEDRGYYLDMVHEGGFRSRLAYIGHNTQSSMFGYAMAAADVNRDGLSELLVGAPAQTEDGRRDLGALHVFVGGDLLSRNDKKRMRTVLADRVDGRFGSAIATSDIDGDSLNEIFVSAPYEDSGVVYVLSGYELKQVFFKEDGFKLVRLSHLKLTQELRGDDGGFKVFGFSLQVVKDVDENGCDELAIGAPDSSSVKLVRCLPAVNVSIALELLGNSTVAVDAESFTIKVCLNVTINKKCQSVSGNISVESFATGHTKMLAPKFTHNITMMDKVLTHCEPIKVDLTIDAEKTDYTFTTKLNMIDDPNPTAYNSRAVFSAYSEIEKSLTVHRYCVDKSCEPVLSMSYEKFWSGNKSIDFSKSEALNETLTFMLKNKNYDAHRVVLEFAIKGALVRSGECEINKKIVNIDNDEEVYYTCALVKILKKDDSYNLTIPIYLPAPTNSLSLNISALKLYDALFPNQIVEEKPLVITYNLNANDVSVNGSSNNLNVTDKDLQDGIIFVESSAIHQKFIISNAGPVTWNGIHAYLQIKNEYIQNVTVVTRSDNENWDQQYDHNDSSVFIFHDQMTIKPKSNKIIEVSMLLNKDKLEGDITKGNLSIIISALTFGLVPLSDGREATSSTQIIYNQILTVGNDKWSIILIAVILAVLLLLILMIVLYKKGFFKRAEKKKLSVLRDSIRKRSLRLASQSSRGMRPSIADGIHCEIEVGDDCAFHEVDLAPTSTRSELSLVETSPKEQTS